ncbi:hypothetical protein [Glaciecola sp. 1036]|uniref:hypothetical protein n=1 Tax=Alteromonadaceae TaxID=72275 RepID=UPI003D0918E3
MRVFHYLLLCCLALQGTLNGVSAFMHFQQQSLQVENALLICTGTSVKWIDSDVYFNTGQIVEITSSDLLDTDESGNPLKADQRACANATVYDHCFSITPNGINLASIFAVYVAKRFVLPWFSPTSHYFTTPATRAPPIFL